MTSCKRSTIEPLIGCIKRESGENPEQTGCCDFQHFVCRPKHIREHYGMLSESGSVDPEVTDAAKASGRPGRQRNKSEDLPFSRDRIPGFPGLKPTVSREDWDSGCFRAGSVPTACGILVYRFPYQGFIGCRPFPERPLMMVGEERIF